MDIRIPYRETIPLISAVTNVSAQLLCYMDSEHCSNSISQPVSLSTEEECCLGSGLSFSDVDQATCHLCVGTYDAICVIVKVSTIRSACTRGIMILKICMHAVFGFSQTMLAAWERGPSYTIEVGYVKGGGGVARDVQVQVVEDGTAGRLYAAHLSCINFEHNMV